MKRTQQYYNIARSPISRPPSLSLCSLAALRRRRTQTQKAGEERREKSRDKRDDSGGGESCCARRYPLSLALLLRAPLRRQVRRRCVSCGARRVGGGCGGACFLGGTACPSRPDQGKSTGERSHGFAACLPCLFLQPPRSWHPRQRQRPSLNVFDSL